MARSGTVEAADAWSESATELSSTGLDKLSGCNKSELRMTPFCLHRSGSRWTFGRSAGVVNTVRVPVSLTGGRCSVLRFAGLWAEGLDRAAAPNMNTPLEAVSGIVEAVGGAKGNGERNCTAS